MTSNITDSNTTNVSREFGLDTMCLVIDGIAWSGKGMIGSILGSFAGVEIMKEGAFTQFFSVLHNLGKITRDAAVVLMKTEADSLLVDSLIGRNTNFRVKDSSSVWHNPNPWRYFRRVLLEDKIPLQDRINNHRPIFQWQTHGQLANFELYYEAFGERLRMVEMIRHPVDLIGKWMRRGYGELFGVNPLHMTLCVRYHEHDVPYLAVGWEDIYLSTNPAERVVRMIGSQWDHSYNTYKSISKMLKEQILIVPFEDFVQHPKPYLSSLEQFIKSCRTRHTSRILRRANCPRILHGRQSLDARESRKKSLELQLSKEARYILNRLIDEYETVSTKFVL
tara:strand:+ start:986 stop:1993 length:1008 start_codon:yes stop_codon:yes gene_type:complete